MAAIASKRLFISVNHDLSNNNTGKDWKAKEKLLWNTIEIYNTVEKSKQNVCF